MFIIIGSCSQKSRVMCTLKNLTIFFNAGIGIREKNSGLKENAGDFHKLYEREWSANISTQALKTMDTNKFNKITLLPITSDVVKVKNFIQSKMPDVRKRLESNPNIDDWRFLAELVGTRLTFFNRRRGNEVYQLLIRKFESRNEIKNSQIAEIKETLTPLERHLMQRYVLYVVLKIKGTFENHGDD